MNFSDDSVAATTFRELLRSPSQGIVAVDRTGTIQLMNDRAEEIFGYAHGELVGRKIDVLVPAPVREIHNEELSEYFDRPRSRSMGIGMEVTGRRRDNTEFPAEISLNHLQVGGETIVLSLVTDITERTEIEEHARYACEMDAVCRLASGVAQEFDQILGEISRHVDIALDNCGGNAGLRHSIEAISGAAGQAAILMRRLLASSGDQAGQASWFDLNHKLLRMRTVLSEVLGKRTKLRFVLGEDIGEILADPLQFEQIIANLVENAHDAMPDGGLLKIETAAIEVGEEHSHWHLPVSPGPYVMLTFTDTGIGMSPEVRQHLFEPFFSTKPAGQGNGLGLATVYGILRNSGGSILADSKLNQGTTIRVILPRIPDDRAAGSLDESGSQTSLTSEDAD